MTLKERRCFLGAKARVGGGGGAGEEYARGEKRVLAAAEFGAVKREEEEEDNRNCNRRRWRCAIYALWEWRALQHRMRMVMIWCDRTREKSMVSLFLSLHFFFSAALPIHHFLFLISYLFQYKFPFIFSNKYLTLYYLLSYNLKNSFLSREKCDHEWQIHTIILWTHEC